MVYVGANKDKVTIASHSSAPHRTIAQQHMFKDTNLLKYM